AAHDRADARHLLMALAVAEEVATREPLVARPRRAVTVAGDARVVAHAGATATTGATFRVAVDVIAGTAVAERRVVGLPPARRVRPGWARVLSAVHGAAERGPSGTARRIGTAQRRVCGARPQEVAQRVHDQRRREDRGPHEEAAARDVAPAEALRD